VKQHLENENNPDYSKHLQFISKVLLKKQKTFLIQVCRFRLCVICSTPCI